MVIDRMLSMKHHHLLNLEGSGHVFVVNFFMGEHFMHSVDEWFISLWAFLGFYSCYFITKLRCNLFIPFVN